ncbi:nitroreductase family protein [Acetobacter cerevisiae]|uniref:nitroreductase family protein n=1 Tax=Acetobacter cerevisiae TaxID=178900 RepID=UPI0020A0E3E7|nr:nitroreductase [Acetobacter cerevisiae]MCP1269496.1 nitroreductase [Acetobacter cerevisiae]MCP1277450.1 nitroreductase [Acetobacter cerevisiae]
MTPMDMLLTRASTDHLAEPAPSDAQLSEILAAAMRAPDHGKLRPWRYVVIRDEARPVLAERIVASMKRMDAEAPEFKIEKRRKRFSTMPLILALGMHLRPDHKIPLWEQEMAVAAAAMNVLNALHATGFGGVWVSGDVVDDRVLAAELGLPAPHRLAGFLFIGTPEGEQHAPKRPDPAEFTASWTGKPVQFAADRT